MTVDTMAPPDERTRRRLAPADLSDFPAVPALLHRLDLGDFTEEALQAFPGRNDNWAGPTTRDRSVFVKHIGGPAEESLRRFRRVLAFERAAAAADERADGVPMPRPKLIGSDEATRLLAFELVADSVSGSDLASRDEFDETLAHEAGRIVGALHALRPADGTGIEDTPAPLPPLGHLRALPWAAYVRASAGALEAWRLLQGDSALHQALHDLRAAESRAPRTPVHGDLRLDQFLTAPGSPMLLTDWEEFRHGDPARDLGAFAGDWLYRAVLKVPSGLAQAPGVPVSHAEVVATGTAELARVTPLIGAFHRGYGQVRPGAAALDPGLLARATAFAGWHLLDRLLASAEHSARLSAAERAAAGIGRTALLSPAAFVSVLGWEGTQA
ncbi:class V lanthionine synthetase subunit LxmK [Streptomyces sp. L2]|uniref:class V lanthionine synthetase subunit LxmK n=1 Tax=Streptomyces sp. L2 TaxID=2162665 RepID=UPI001010AEFF|nr:class V lanthionine synthetase subunit LxmK [Streptomyces sp. L2]